MPSQKSAQKSAGKTAKDMGGKPGQPKKASPAQASEKKKAGPVAGGTI